MTHDLTPTEPGTYWGRWHTPAPDTRDGKDACPGDSWEVHRVFIHAVDPDDPEQLRAFVPGVEESQPLDGFEWGPRVWPFSDKAAA